MKGTPVIQKQFKNEIPILCLTFLTLNPWKNGLIAETLDCRERVDKNNHEYFVELIRTPKTTNDNMAALGITWWSVCLLNKQTCPFYLPHSNCFNTSRGPTV